MRRARLWPEVAALLVIASAISCGGDSAGPAATQLVIQPTAVIIGQQASQQLSVAVLDAEGALLTGTPVTFRSSDTLIVTVSPTGVVLSVGPTGTASITVKSSHLEAEVPVTVRPTSTSLSVTPSVTSIPQRGSVQLHAALLDALGNPVPGASFTYTSLNPALASVSVDGLVTSIGPSGEVAVRVNSAAFSAQAGIAILQLPTTLTVTPELTTIGVGGHAQLSVHLFDAVQVEIFGVSVTYDAVPGALLSASNSGLVTSVGGVGSGTVTVRSGGLTATGRFNVVTSAHPAGTIAATTPMAGGPWGAAVSASGVVYVAGIASVLGRAALTAFGITTQAIPFGNTTAVTFNHAGTQAWVANSPTASLALYNPADNSLVATVPGLGGDVYGVLVSADDQTVYAAGSDGVVYAISTSTHSIQWQVPTNRAIIHLAEHPFSPLIYASTAGAIEQINVTTRDVRQIGVTGHAQAIAVSADGSELYIANESTGLNVFDFGTNTMRTIAIGCGGYGLVLTPDDLQLYVSCPASGAIKVVDRGTKSVLATIVTTGSPRRLAASHDGLTIVAPNESGWVDFIR
jgi:hypothetical protein